MMDWKDNLKVELVSWTSNMREVLAEAASVCRGTEPKTGDAYMRQIRGIVDRNEGSVIEHGTFSFRILGISAVALGHLVRHRIASYTVESQRYVERDNSYLFPFLDTKRYSDKSTLKILSDYIKKGYELYHWLIDDKGWRKEFARHILSNSDTRNMVTTFNLRSLRNFFKVRLHKSAQLEIRYIAWQMLLIANERCPEVFGDFYEQYGEIF